MVTSLLLIIIWTGLIHGLTDDSQTRIDELLLKRKNVAEKKMSQQEVVEKWKVFAETFGIIINFEEGAVWPPNSQTCDFEGFACIIKQVMGNTGHPTNKRNLVCDPTQITDFEVEQPLFCIAWSCFMSNDWQTCSNHMTKNAYILVASNSRISTKNAGNIDIDAERKRTWTEAEKEDWRAKIRFLFVMGKTSDYLTFKRHIDVVEQQYQNKAWTDVVAETIAEDEQKLNRVEKNTYRLDTAVRTLNETAATTEQLKFAVEVADSQTKDLAAVVDVLRTINSDVSSKVDGLTKQGSMLRVRVHALEDEEVNLTKRVDGVEKLVQTIPDQIDKIERKTRAVDEISGNWTELQQRLTRTESALKNVSELNAKIMEIELNFNQRKQATDFGNLLEDFDLNNELVRRMRAVDNLTDFIHGTTDVQWVMSTGELPEERRKRDVPMVEVGPVEKDEQEERKLLIQLGTAGISLRRDGRLHVFDAIFKHIIHFEQPMRNFDRFDYVINCNNYGYNERQRDEQDYADVNRMCERYRSFMKSQQNELNTALADLESKINGSSNDLIRAVNNGGRFKRDGGTTIAILAGAALVGSLYSGYKTYDLNKEVDVVRGDLATLTHRLNSITTDFAKTTDKFLTMNRMQDEISVEMRQAIATSNLMAKEGRRLMLALQNTTAAARKRTNAQMQLLSDLMVATNMAHEQMWQLAKVKEAAKKWELIADSLSRGFLPRELIGSSRLADLLTQIERVPAMSGLIPTFQPENSDFYYNYPMVSVLRSDGVSTTIQLEIPMTKRSLPSNYEVLALYTGWVPCRNSCQSDSAFFRLKEDERRWLARDGFFESLAEERDMNCMGIGKARRCLIDRTELQQPEDCHSGLWIPRGAIDLRNCELLTSEKPYYRPIRVSHRDYVIHAKGTTNGEVWLQEKGSSAKRHKIRGYAEVFTLAPEARIEDIGRWVKSVGRAAIDGQQTTIALVNVDYQMNNLTTISTGWEKEFEKRDKEWQMNMRLVEKEDTISARLEAIEVKNREVETLIKLMEKESVTRKKKNLLPVRSYQTWIPSIIMQTISNGMFFCLIITTFWAGSRSNAVPMIPTVFKIIDSATAQEPNMGTTEDESFGSWFKRKALEPLDDGTNETFNLWYRKWVYNKYENNTAEEGTAEWQTIAPALAIDAFIVTIMILICLVVLWRGVRRRVKIQHFFGQMVYTPLYPRYQRLGIRVTFSLEENSIWQKNLQIITLVLPIESNLEAMPSEVIGGYADCSLAVIYKSQPKEDWLEFAEDIKIRFVNKYGQIASLTRVCEIRRFRATLVEWHPRPPHGISQSFYALATVEVLPDPRRIFGTLSNYNRPIHNISRKVSFKNNDAEEVEEDELPGRRIYHTFSNNNRPIHVSRKISVRNNDVEEVEEDGRLEVTRL